METRRERLVRGNRERPGQEGSGGKPGDAGGQ